jgi:hypothetical protein
LNQKSLLTLLNILRYIHPFNHSKLDMEVH